MTYPIIKYSEMLYKTVAASTEDQSVGIIPVLNQEISIYRFRANGSDPSAYVALIWDRDGEDELIFASTKGDIDLVFDVSNPDLHLVGDGLKKLQICLINDNETLSPIIGGQVECVEVD